MDMLQLYRNVFRSTFHSFTCGWRAIIAVTIFGVVMLMVTRLVTSLDGMSALGMMGASVRVGVDALLLGATLSLIQQMMCRNRQVTMQDIWDSLGRYFWDVMGVGFVLAFPWTLLGPVPMLSPNEPFVTAANTLLFFIVLNPAPEVIYQLRPDSPLDVLSECYKFVIKNWIEWFLPLAIAITPLGLQGFVQLLKYLGEPTKFDLLHLLTSPFLLVGEYLGVPAEADWLLLILAPSMAVAMLLFRGHLFASLRTIPGRR